ncbi:MAG: MarR family transcriptional regulator [Cyclobacteriaceae bacterium]|nr:MarR family transcriptional regulator [Cyclobacteriaceae bacterium]
MEPKHLDENIAFLIGKASHLFYSRVTGAFREKKIDVTVEQFSILTILWYDDGLLQQEIANRLNRDKTTLTRVINNMEKRNLVVRIPDKSDRRVNLIHLTYLGKELQKTLTETTGNIYLKSIEGLSPDKLRHLVENLNTIINNLQ